MMAFQTWLCCPECDSEETSVLAFRTVIVLECYGCGRVEEFEFGEEIPVQQLDVDAIARKADND